MSDIDASGFIRRSSSSKSNQAQPTICPTQGLRPIFRPIIEVGISGSGLYTLHAAIEAFVKFQLVHKLEVPLFRSCALSNGTSMQLRSSLKDGQAVASSYEAQSHSRKACVYYYQRAFCLESFQCIKPSPSEADYSCFK
jgi:hypothetical protein